MGPERKVEQHLIKRVTAMGGYCIKFIPVVAGMPDRIVFLRGRILLVELKAKDGRLRPVQRVWHKRLQQVGVPIAVLSSKEQVDSWLSFVFD